MIQKVYSKQFGTTQELIEKTVSVISQMLQKNKKFTHGFWGAGQDSREVLEVITRLKERFKLKFQYKMTDCLDSKGQKYVRLEMWLGYIKKQ